MKIYMIKDYVRVDGVTGNFVEKEFSGQIDKYDRELSLHSGLNQFISFQIVIDSEGKPVNSIDVRLSDLSGPANLSSKETELFAEWFHDTEGQAIPDCLIPLSAGHAFQIPQDDRYLPNQRVGALWVDLFIPKDAVAGKYTGTVNVKADEEERQFMLHVHVHDVTVPDESLLTADLNAYADSISPLFPRLYSNPDRYEDGSFFEAEKQIVKMAREHRTLFHNLGYRHSGQVVPSFAPELEGEGKHIRVKSWELFDRHFGPYLDGTAFADSRRGTYPIEYMYLPFNIDWPARFSKWGKKGFRTETRRIIAEFIRHFEEKGWTQTGFEIFLNNKKMYRFFPFTLDEIWYEHDEEPFEEYYDIIRGTYDHTPVQFLFRADESNHYGNHYKNEYADMSDFWVVASSMFRWFPDSVKVMKQKGNIVWLYGGVIGELSRDLMKTFTWPMHAFMADIQGFCVWNTLGHGKSDYLKEPIANEVIMYPGVHFGIQEALPSIRLKALRNVMQITDVMMTTKGFEFETEEPYTRKVKDIVNRHFGFQSDEQWWTETPDFVDTPPRYWDFGGTKVEEACRPFLWEDVSLTAMEQIQKEVLELLGATGEF